MAHPFGLASQRHTRRMVLVLAAAVASAILPSSTVSATAIQYQAVDSTTVDLSGFTKVSTQGETAPQNGLQNGHDLNFGFIQIVGGASGSADAVTRDVATELVSQAGGQLASDTPLGAQLQTIADLAGAKGLTGVARAGLLALPGVCGVLCKAAITVESAPFASPRSTAALYTVTLGRVTTSGTVTLTVTTTDRRPWQGYVGANVQICRVGDNLCRGFPICKVPNKPCQVQVLYLGEKGFSHCAANPVCTVQLAWHNSSSASVWQFKTGDQLVARLQVWAETVGSPLDPSVTATEVSISDLKVGIETLTMRP